jgi:TolA-binding protein
VKSSHSIAAAALAATTFLSAPVLAQRQPATPEQRIERLERQIDQVQRQVFPRGKPANTAGFATEPAATQSSVTILDQRLDALERQMADILRQSEENGNQLRILTGDLQRVRDEQQQRINALEQRLSEAAANTVVEPVASQANSTKPADSKPSTPKPATTKPATVTAEPVTAGPAIDAGEEAYTEGFRLWEAGNYDEAITSLRAFTSAYPKHRRVSFANNLIGRALLDKGQPRAAAEALLANYRSNPKGERAPDSLYYLGQALMKLGQPGQACKAYSELDAVYGTKVRADLKQQVQAAQSSAQCS